MNRMKCIGCKKPLKKGEFVVLNGGALVKTKTGSAMGDKTLQGFLTVNNHFDSKKNYRGLILADEQPNGQFEFYACSHKCLANFMSKQIMHLAKFDKIKKIVMAPSNKLNKIGDYWWRDVVSRMGFEGALVTDESSVFDFIGPWNAKGEEAFVKKISKTLGFPVKATDRIWKLAKTLKENTEIKAGV
jgi:hypothetical protein